MSFPTPQLLSTFFKMHGLGNDFVIFVSQIDHRDDVMEEVTDTICLQQQRARCIANRKTGIGCDQVVFVKEVVGHGRKDLVRATVRFFNADGSQAEACGNATRCVAYLLLGSTSPLSLTSAAPRRETEESPCRLEVTTLWNKRTTHCRLLTEDAVSLSAVVALQMCVRLMPHQEIMTDAAADCGVSFFIPADVGNPHAVFLRRHEEDEADSTATAFLSDVNLSQRLAVVARSCSNHFPNGVNVEAVVYRPLEQPEQGDGSVPTVHARMRVDERGAGITQACGTGATAVAAALAEKCMTDSGIDQRKCFIPTEVIVEMDGGSLTFSHFVRSEAENCTEMQLLMRGAAQCVAWGTTPL